MKDIRSVEDNFHGLELIQGHFDVVRLGCNVIIAHCTTGLT